MKRTRAVLTLMMPAAPKPCTTRASVSETSPVDRAQSSEATVNTTKPTWYTRR